jgi:hypothetical protein
MFDAIEDVNYLFLASARIISSLGARVLTVKIGCASDI